MLKHHANFAPDGLDVLDISGQLNSIHFNGAALKNLKAVKTPDHCGFSRTGRTTDDNPFTQIYIQIDVREGVEIPVPFI